MRAAGLDRGARTDFLGDAIPAGAADVSDLPRSGLKGAAIALAAFGLYSTHDVEVKFLGGVYTPFHIIFFSVLFSFPLATLMLMRDPVSGNLRPVHPWWTALRTVAGVLSGLSGFYAFTVLPMAQVYAILFSAPLLISVLSIPILGERLGLHRWVAVVLGLIGVLVVLRPGTVELSLGHISALTAALTSAVVAVVVRKIGRDERSAVLMLYPMMANFALMGAILPRVYVPMPIEHLGLLAVMSLLGFTAGLGVIAAYRSGDAAVVAPMQYSQILWAAGFGVLIFDEYGDRFTWLGAGIVIASGLYIVLRERRGGASRVTPVLTTRTRFESATGPRFGLLFRPRQPPQ